MKSHSNSRMYIFLLGLFFTHCKSVDSSNLSSFELNSNSEKIRLKSVCDKVSRDENGNAIETSCTFNKIARFKVKGNLEEAFRDEGGDVVVMPYSEAESIIRASGFSWSQDLIKNFESTEVIDASSNPALERKIQILDSSFQRKLGLKSSKENEASKTRPVQSTNRIEVGGAVKAQEEAAKTTQVDTSEEASELRMQALKDFFNILQYDGNLDNRCAEVLGTFSFAKCYISERNKNWLDPPFEELANRELTRLDLENCFRTGNVFVRPGYRWSGSCMSLQDYKIYLEKMRLELEKAREEGKKCCIDKDGKIIK